MEKLIAIAKKWNSLNNDKERWKYILSHKTELCLMLDNDLTSPAFHPSIIENFNDYFPELNDFHNDIGNSGGIHELMEVLGIKAEGV